MTLVAIITILICCFLALHPYYFQFLIVFVYIGRKVGGSDKHINRFVSVEPPNKGHLGDNIIFSSFVPCREVVVISDIVNVWKL